MCGKNSTCLGDLSMIAINLDTVAQHLFVDEVGKNRPISLNEEAQRDRLNVEETRENIRGGSRSGLSVGF